MAEYGQIGRYRRMRADQDAQFCRRVFDACVAAVTTGAVSELPPVAQKWIRAINPDDPNSMNNLIAVLLDPFVCRPGPSIIHRVRRPGFVWTGDLPEPDEAWMTDTPVDRGASSADVVKKRVLLVTPLINSYRNESDIWALVSDRRSVTTRGSMWAEIWEIVSEDGTLEHTYTEFCRRCIARSCAEGYFCQTLVENLLGMEPSRRHTDMRDMIIGAVRGMDMDRAFAESRFTVGFWCQIVFTPVHHGGYDDDDDDDDDGMNRLLREADDLESYRVMEMLNNNQVTYACAEIMVGRTGVYNQSQQFTMLLLDNMAHPDRAAFAHTLVDALAAAGMSSDIMRSDSSVVRRVKLAVGAAKARRAENGSVADAAKRAVDAAIAAEAATRDAQARIDARRGHNNPPDNAMVHDWSDDDAGSGWDTM